MHATVGFGYLVTLRINVVHAYSPCLLYVDSRVVNSSLRQTYLDVCCEVDDADTIDGDVPYHERRSSFPAVLEGHIHHIPLHLSAGQERSIVSVGLCGHRRNRQVG